MTGSLGIKDDLVNAGAIWEDAPAVVDRHLQVAAAQAALLPRAGWLASLAERSGRALRPGLVLPRSMALTGRSSGAIRRLQAFRERV